MRRAIPLLLVLLALVACSGGDAGAPDARGERPPGPGAAPAPPDPDAEAARHAVARHQRLLLVEGGTSRTLATLEDGAARFEHAALRPGDHDSDTVLALTRTRDAYELRYLVVDEDGGTSDLYGFPWRLQVDSETAEHADVAPLPVWAPDGSQLAWLEWDEGGTRLRTVGWMDADGANNPSDETAVYPLGQVPVGAQLQRWEAGGDTPVLVADDGEVVWRIELAPGQRAVAMSVDGSGD